MSGIYIHIPFCKQKCSYCNFHFSTRLKGIDAIQQALLTEIDTRSEEIASQVIETIYLGGGTPSLWSVEDINSLYSRVMHQTGRPDILEFTIECNPDDLSMDYLEDLKKYTEISRISLGIQSFHDEDLTLMNRSHDALEARKSLENIFKTGFEEVSADLIFGLPPGDNTISIHEKWRRNLEIMVQYPVNHISCYNLTIEDNTLFKHQKDRGLLDLPEDEQTMEQFYAAKSFFQQNGFDHYEISNYAKPGHHALHNTNYWKNTPYIGIGPSAHSYDGFRRRWNVADNQKYQKLIHAGEVYWDAEDLTEWDRYNEYIMTGLRTMWGVEEEKIDQFSADLSLEFYRNLKLEKLKGNIVSEKARHVLSSQGQAIADSVISGFFYV